MSYSSYDSQRPTAELINIIKELFYNPTGENTDERDRIIKKVELQFNECDQRIDKYIRMSSKDLTNLIKVFNDIAHKIEQSRTSVSNSRQALKQCKILLQSKRDDVRRLWLEWCEQKCYYENINKIRELYMASETIRGLCTQKKFLEASRKVADYTRLLDDDFREVTGLNDIKRVLEDERIKLEKCLLNELTDHLYTNVTKSVLESGQTVAVTAQTTSLAMLSREASFRRRFRHHAVRSTNINKEETSTTAITADQAPSNNADDQQMDAEAGDSDSESTSQASDSAGGGVSSSSLVVIERIVQAAAKLNNVDSNINIIENMINEVNRNITNQLINMINATSTHVLESNLIDNSKTRVGASSKQALENNPKFLCQLIDLTVEQFKIMAHHYRHFIDASSRQSQIKYPNSGIVWSCIQNVLIHLLEEYLDTSSVRHNQTSSQEAHGNLDRVDINSFFQRKRLLNLPFGSDNDDDDGTHTNIFTFKGSSHAMSITSYISEQNNENLFGNAHHSLSSRAMSSSDLSNGGRIFKILVCQPAHRNITAIFSTIEHVLKDISDEIRALPATNKTELTLDKFINEFILNTFITNAVESIKENARIHETSSSDLTPGQYEISKQLISFTKQRELGLNKPILQNILLVYQSCLDLNNLIKDMNSYASEFTKAMHSLIEKHADYCNKLFLSIVTNSVTGSYVYSMRWVLDENIKNYFQQLPAFSVAIKGKPTVAAQLTVNRETGPGVNQAALMAAEVELIQFDIEVSSKEVETLISNLCGDRDELDEVDIITNFNYIEMVAHLHESSDWLLLNLKQIVQSLDKMIKNPKSLNSSLSIGELNRFVKQLDDLDKWRGDTLLLLYLETRVHCFYHLLSFLKQENNTSYAGDVDTDPDDCVLNMNRDLHRIYEHLNRSLLESKVNYVFDALGFMIASIFIRTVKNFKKISTHGIAKMCRNIFHVEQNLSAIRSKSDPHLMKAHRFYELLYKKPEELLNHLIEHEAEFSLNDYINLLNLIYRSQSGYEINSLSDNIASLTSILKNKH